MTLKTPEYPNGPDIVVIANDITSMSHFVIASFERCEQRELLR